MQQFKIDWERAETECLTLDRDLRIEIMNRDPNLETEIREKVDELIQKAAEDFMTAEVPPETVVDEEVK